VTVRRKKLEQEISERADRHASETTKRMVQVAAVKAQVEAITRRLRVTIEELEEVVETIPDETEDCNGTPDA
jgi:seryl-tRNA synthetase